MFSSISDCTAAKRGVGDGRGGSRGREFMAGATMIMYSITILIETN